MNQKKQIRKELNEYLDKYIPRTELDIYKYVVDFIKKDRKKQLTLTDVTKQSELLLSELVEWLVINTNLDMEKVVEFEERFKQ
mgnify:CR=1 FL=1|tara:strand:- start:147 stop:395 length:249 start_codon:yes stop_codon:yes gene_type:complete